MAANTLDPRFTQIANGRHEGQRNGMYTVDRQELVVPPQHADVTAPRTHPGVNSHPADVTASRGCKFTQPADVTAPCSCEFTQPADVTAPCTWV